MEAAPVEAAEGDEAAPMEAAEEPEREDEEDDGPPLYAAPAMDDDGAAGGAAMDAAEDDGGLPPYDAGVWGDSDDAQYDSSGDEAARAQARADALFLNEDSRGST